MGDLRDIGRVSRVVLGVGGGIAAYKAAELLRRFTESGHQVRVVPTASALHFVGEATWAALSGQPDSTEVWSSVQDVPHVRIGQSVGGSRQQVSGGWRDDDEFGTAPDLHVRYLGGVRPDVGVHRMVRQRGPGCGAYEIERGRGWHDGDVVPGFGQFAQ